MKGGARSFYLAVFALLGTTHASSVASKSQSTPPDVCAINPKAVVSDACATYSTLDQLNRQLSPSLESITQTTDFFAYYRLNLFNKQCPFWNDANSMCGNIACAVNTLDNEEDIPLIWRADALGKLEGPKAGHPGKKLRNERKPEKPLEGMLGDDVGESCVVEYDDECDERDYCVPEDESATGKGDYVSLVDNPERFTGYAGEGAQMVWNAIYRENCFSKSSFPASASLGKPVFPAVGPAANDLKSVLFNPSGSNPAAELAGAEDECLEKRVFYRVISGMHASISSHICYDYLNQTTGEWTPNLNCYIERLHKHPERISNLYFNYALVVRAVAKLGPYLKTYTFCSGDVAQDRETKMKVQELTTKAGQTPQIFDESLMFVNGEGPSLKEDFKNRFRNVSRLMDCVGCDKCRLWGKLQTAGYGTALKILFEFDNEGQNQEKDVEAPYLKRTEIVALFNTLARISSSLTAVEKFRDMVEAQEHADGVMDGDHYHKISDRERLSHHVVFGEEKERVLKDAEARKKGEAKAVTESEDEDDDFDDLMEDLQNEKKKAQKKQDEMGVMEMFWQELAVVVKVTQFVLMSYVRLPGVLWKIAVLELNRLWEFYIGLPVTPRMWTRGIGRPNIDEL